MIKHNDSSNVASSCDNGESGSISELQHLTIVLSIRELSGRYATASKYAAKIASESKS